MYHTTLRTCFIFCYATFSVFIQLLQEGRILFEIFICVQSVPLKDQRSLALNINSGQKKIFTKVT